MKYPLLIQIHWREALETIVIESPDYPSKGSEITTTEMLPDELGQIEYLTRVLSHETSGTKHRLKLEYSRADNPNLAEIVDVWGISEIIFDTAGKTSPRAKWRNNPSNEYDGKALKVKLIWGENEAFLGYTSILRRKRNQKLFKRELLKIEGRCALTGETEQNVLEAAHIKEVKNSGGFSPANGLLLRADIHLLFDRGLISINPENGQVTLADTVPQNSAYRILVLDWCLQSSTLKRVKKSLLQRVKDNDE